MGMGTFLRGAVTGMVGLGVLSWLISSHDNDERTDESESAYDPDEED